MGGRSLINATVAVNGDGEPVITCVCDCGEVTEVVIVGPLAAGEFAYTCDGCQTSHWITAITHLGGTDG